MYFCYLFGMLEEQSHSVSIWLNDSMRFAIAYITAIVVSVRVAAVNIVNTTNMPQTASSKQQLGVFVCVCAGI